ncbi:MAG: Glu/Leu/Phe/Val dehydrogenase [Pseudomonadales bacterium]
MTVFNHPEFQHEQVHFCQDKASGLNAIIAIHNTRLGPALGGCRMYPYNNDETALTDVLKLSRSMTYKAAMAGLAYGGGKAVIIGDPSTDKNEAMLQAMGHFIEQLNGHYITAEDVGTSVSDLLTIAKRTHYVAGISDKLTSTGSPRSGDPSPATAYGVFVGIKVAVEQRLGYGHLAGLKVSIQGLGKVGYQLAVLLHDAGVKLYVSDLNVQHLQKAVTELDATPLSPQQLLQTQTDIFAPCAMGGILDESLIEQLPVVIIAGSANNQLATERIGELLHQRGILYAPDFVINAGGLIDIAHELGIHNPKQVHRQLDNIGHTLTEIFKCSQQQNCPTHSIACSISEERIHQVMDAA